MNKRTCMAMVMCLMVGVSMAHARRARVALLDFTDETGQKSDALLGGKLDTKAFAEKGTYVLARELVNGAGYQVIDRRDLVRQMEKQQFMDDGRKTAVKPSFIQAAQQLNADAVLRGSLISLSTGSENIKQGGYNVSFDTVSVRVMIEAIDAIDGSVIAVAEGVNKNRFRQTDNVQTEMGEDDMFEMLQAAMKQAMPDLKSSLDEKLVANDELPKIYLTVDSTDNPAMIEIDGVLVGTTPADRLEVYRGDHVLSITRPGYEAMTKRINLATDATIKVPMLRTDLTAEEKKEIMSQADMKYYFNDGPRPDMLIQTIE